MNQILRYPGGKARIADWIISHFPPHEVYCEPFFGSGAVFFRKAPIRIETINDINGDVVNLFRVCREHPDELAQLVALTPYSREEYRASFKPTDDPIERARRTLVKYHQSFARSAQESNGWRNTQVSTGPSDAKVWNKLPELFGKISRRLKDAQIENSDALELIKRYDNPETLLYLDPPYPLDLRRKNMYCNEMTQEQHEEMLSLVKKSKSKIILSSYANELYDKELSSWLTAEKGCIAQMGAKRTEKIYMNFQPPLLVLGV